MRTVLMFALVFAAAGCGGDGTTARPEGRETAPPPQKAAPDSPTSRVEVLPITYAGLDRAIQQQKGKVVLVDVWSLA
jgi:hypothetical protein